MSSQVGRNDLCLCGSEKKYKNCCGRSGFHFRANKRNMLMLGGVIAVVITVIMILSNNASSPNFQSGSPGSAPPGKVWSTEHGHWHDAPGTATPILPNVQAPGATAPIRNFPLPGVPSVPTQTSSQPPGPAPPGKVWSPEHAHWHDAPGTTPIAIPDFQAPSTPTQNVPQPPGEAPAGKVWSPQHGHWHDAP